MPLHRSVTIKLVFAACTLLAVALPWADPDALIITAGQLAQFEKTYGRSARTRLAEWQQLMARHADDPEDQKLQVVNGFFNQLEFVDDSVHWGKADYWATPVEMLATAGGDCEDFSIAKYFTLKAMGVDESKLKLTYVKAIRINQAHMVLTYFAKPDAEPLVLDNLIGEIKKAGLRKDLQPVYSFNGEGLWLAKQRGVSGKMVSGSERLSLWQDLLHRMQQQSDIQTQQEPRP
jgi:predicted transglutaminase-like cysteine proteinase